MSGYNDEGSGKIRTPKDILRRASRPQKHSTYQPRTRDWRYKAGILRAEDNGEDPRERTWWDRRDQVYLAERRRRQRHRDYQIRHTRADRAIASEGSLGVVQSVEGLERNAVNQPTQKASASTRQNGGRGQEHNIAKRISVESFKRNRERLLPGMSRWIRTSYVVVMQVRKGTAGTEQNPNEALPTIPTTCSSTSTAKSALEKSARLKLFKGEWADETRNFNMAMVCGLVRRPDKDVKVLPGSFHWFPDAVPVDALFPPGVAVTAKEILAFYPHHIRWPGVTIRLFANGFRASHITGIQAWFRGEKKHPLSVGELTKSLSDPLKRLIPGFQSTTYTFKAKRFDPYTDELQPPDTATKRGFIVPRFEDLVTGLKYLPKGLDARDLTQCVVWYLQHRDYFHPRLELNVLHTQSLIRALKQSLQPTGKRNLDCLCLQEWKDKGKFDKREVVGEKGDWAMESEKGNHKTRGRKRLHISVEKGKVTPEVDIRLRHVLTFPYMSIGNMMALALQMGIEKAEAKKAEREGVQEMEWKAED